MALAAAGLAAGCGLGSHYYDRSVIADQYGKRPTLGAGADRRHHQRQSAVAERLAALGAGVVDTDRVAHALTAPGGAAMPALAAAFGPEIVQADGAMDRAAMRAQVFADPRARQQLEAILHPMIRAQTEAELATCPGIIWCWWCRSWWKPEPICRWPTGCWWWTAR